MRAAGIRGACFLRRCQQYLWHSVPPEVLVQSTIKGCEAAASLITGQGYTRAQGPGFNVIDDA